jgi:hypothetical protein
VFCTVPANVVPPLSDMEKAFVPAVCVTVADTDGGCPPPQVSVIVCCVI